MREGIDFEAWVSAISRSVGHPDAPENVRFRKVLGDVRGGLSRLLPLLERPGFGRGRFGAADLRAMAWLLGTIRDDAQTMLDVLSLHQHRNASADPDIEVAVGVEVEEVKPGGAAVTFGCGANVGFVVASDSSARAKLRCDVEPVVQVVQDNSQVGHEQILSTVVSDTSLEESIVKESS